VKRAWLLCGAALALSTAESGRADTPPGGPRLLHVPAGARTAEQGILTPVPVSLEVPTDLPARRVLLHYKLFGIEEWRTLELRREGTRYVGAIPCLEVNSLAGQIVYYVRVHDIDGAVIAFSGTRASPYRVAVHHPSARPDLANGEGRCPDPADCPPGLPGCPSAEVERVPCQRDADCEGGQTCGWDSFCTDDPRRRNWFSVELSQGAGLVMEQGACSVASQENEGYACFRQRDGAIYRGRPVYSDEGLAAGVAPTRVLISYERLLFYNTSLAARLGYAFAGSGPTLPGAREYVPFSAELVARYWLGSDPFARRRLRSYVLLGMGAGEFDVAFDAHVREDPDAPYTQAGNDLEQELEAWRRAGDGFVSLGVGATYSVSDALAPLLELSASQTFPYGALVVSGNIGIKVGVP
jgi:hypothetical protein